MPLKIIVIVKVIHFFCVIHKMILKKYSLRLKYRIEAFNNDPDNIASGKAPLKDEKGNELVIPAVG